MTNPGKLLVIGGGVGGISAIVGLRKLDKTVQIVLVEPKEYMEICWAAYRSPFEAWVAEGSVLDLTAFCQANHVTHIRALVVTLDTKEATLDNGSVVDFTVAVVASGATSKWPGLGRGPPTDDGSRLARLQAIQREGERLLNAGSILVVGGGIVGTELAGDLKAYANKAGKKLKVTLVHSGEHLCPELSPSAAKMVKDKLENMGVTVILNDRADANEKGEMVLNSAGTVVDANEVIMTTGISACNSFMNQLSAEALNEQGFVNTDDYFRVQGTDGKVFSVGDCCTTLPNSASQILGNMKILGNNIKITMDAIKVHKLRPNLRGLKSFKLGIIGYLVTVGPSDGVFYSAMFWTQYILPRLKNLTMLFFLAKSELGV